MFKLTFKVFIISMGLSLFSQNSLALTLADKPQLQNHIDHKGLSKEEVYSRYGEPQKILTAVGNPPISRWKYDQFTVYFEQEHVIHTVAHGKE